MHEAESIQATHTPQRPPGSAQGSSLLGQQDQGLKICILKCPEVILMLCASFGSHWKYGPNTAVFGIRKIWAQIPALSLISSVTWANNLTP